MSANATKSRADVSVHTSEQKSVFRRTWPRFALVAGIVVAIVVLLQVFGPNGATYEEYLLLKNGMSRQQVEEIIGQGDYWYHMEGENQVASWVNKDGTYIRTVFDAEDALVEASWEIGWTAGSESKGSLWDE